MKTQLTLASAAAALLFSLQAFAAPVNINTADAATLANSLDGVGPVTSKRIVTYREENGGFASPEDLMRVNGIGPTKFEDNKADILVKDQAEGQAEE